jgi:uncharacterized repeat protein (TIGR03803 family)
VSNDTLNQPSAGVTLDKTGNIYATAEGGTWGGVFELTPSAGGWLYSELYTFHGGADGANPFAGLIFEEAGNLYGATTFKGSNGGGTVFELTPSNGGWTFSTLYSFAGVCCDLVGPWANLVMDAGGSLYGTTNEGGAYGYGVVFKLTPGGGGWSYTSLRDFTGGDDGAFPRAMWFSTPAGISTAQPPMGAETTFALMGAGWFGRSRHREAALVSTRKGTMVSRPTKLILA